MDDPNPKFDLARLERLLNSEFNGALPAEDARELGQILADSPEARAVYWERLSIHAGLCWMYKGKLECDNRLADLDIEPREPPQVVLANHQSERAIRWLRWMALTIAPMLLLATWIGRGVGRNDELTSARAKSVKSASESDNIGMLAPLSTDCRWSFGAAGDSSRHEFRSFDTVWLNRGAAELRLNNGTTVQLEAPLILEMVSIDRARVLRGRVTVDVAKGAKGFIVDTAVARIVDHGTTFSVDVSDTANTDVVVFQGEVEVNFMQHGNATGAESVESTKRLRTGEAARVAEDGTLSRIVNVQRMDFSETRTHPSVVNEVRDNFVREQTMKYYEIVHGGMHEDVSAFVDRDYQWNGVGMQGIPNYLIGGDYVKTFNDDKVTQNLVITVTLDRPAKLYLLVDDRLKQTDWLTNQFVDTGDDIGLDEGPHVPNDVRQLAAGPGESIDQVHSIWECRVPPGKTISIGPYRPSVPEGSSLGTKTSLNMYGIVAVPLTVDVEP